MDYCTLRFAKHSTSYNVDLLKKCLASYKTFGIAFTTYIAFEVISRNSHCKTAQYNKPIL